MPRSLVTSRLSEVSLQAKVLQLADQSVCLARFRSSSNHHVSHSGDIIDHEQHQGTHILTIESDKVPQEVQMMLITLSGYLGATLDSFRQVFVEMKDNKTGMDLCQYHLEDVGREKMATHTTVAMCCLTRKHDAFNQWDVKALGQLIRQGGADDYSHILAYVAATWPRGSASAR